MTGPTGTPGKNGDKVVAKVDLVEVADYLLDRLADAVEEGDQDVLRRLRLRPVSWLCGDCGLRIPHGPIEKMMAAEHGYFCQHPDPSVVYQAAYNGSSETTA